jgi:hypothetical protein
MQCIVMYVTGTHLMLFKTSSEIQIFNFGSLSSRVSIYVSKVVRARGYFPKTEKVRDQNIFGNSE